MSPHQTDPEVEALKAALTRNITYGWELEFLLACYSTENLDLTTDHDPKDKRWVVPLQVPDSGERVLDSSERVASMKAARTKIISDLNAVVLPALTTLMDYSDPRGASGAERSRRAAQQSRDDLGQHSVPRSA
jgi:hypothetical protein